MKNSKKHPDNYRDQFERVFHYISLEFAQVCGYPQLEQNNSLIFN